MAAFDNKIALFQQAPRPKIFLKLGRNPIARAISFVFVIVLYRLLLDASYAYVSQIYSYQGLFYNGRTENSIIISWIILLLCMPIFKRIFDDESPSSLIFSLLIIFSILPAISVISFRSDYPLMYLLLLFTYWSIFSIAWFFFPKMQINSFYKFKSEYFHKIVLIALCFSVLIYSYINTGIRFHFSIIDVYDIRSEARGFIAPFPLNYIVSLADNLLPFFAVYALFRKKYLLLILVMFFIYLNFSIAGTKQIIFTLILGMAGYFFIPHYSKSYRLILASTVLLGMGLAEAYTLSSNTIVTLFAYRVLFIPAELHFSYYSYFQTHDILYFSQSILKWLFTNQNQENIQFIIGEYSIGDYTARGNNGLFSDAYMNMGIIGVFIFPVLIAFFLRLIDGAVSGISERIMFVIFIYVSFVLLGMTLTSALLTSGLLFLIPFLYSIPRTTDPSYH
jgi:hypothetical protein